MSAVRYDSIADVPRQMRQQVAGKIVAVAAKTASPENSAGKPQKYHNVKTDAGGIRFDSRKEARRFLALQEAARCGIIYDLRLQQDFTLQEAYTTPEGERIRAIRYRADFTYRIGRANYGMAIHASPEDLDYWRDVAMQQGSGALVVEDVKSKATRTGEYIIKKKMMADKGYIIREV